MSRLSIEAMQVLVNLPSVGQPGLEPTPQDEMIIRRELQGFYMQEGRHYWRLHQGDVLVGVHGQYLDALLGSSSNDYGLELDLCAAVKEMHREFFEHSRITGSNPTVIRVIQKAMTLKLWIEQEIESCTISGSVSGERQTDEANHFVTPSPRQAAHKPNGESA